MSRNTKGFLIFIGILVASTLFCGLVPFLLLPKAGIAMALPVITVPGEKLFSIGGFNVTNTIIGTLLADILTLAFALGATRHVKEIPGRLQGLFEMLTDALYGVAKSTAGANARKVFPFMATLFLFLLCANWLELVPGVDSVGLMHCAEDGKKGYPANGIVLKVDKVLGKSAITATEADYEACHAKLTGEESHAGEAAANNDIRVVTSFVRAAATDLNLTLGLAILAVLTVQYFGVRALGGMYFTKFINTPALGNLDRKPMGLMDFAVGFLEIISEVSRIISFGFRLFGNIFAGQVLLFVIPFLAGALVPFFIYGFEMFVGVIQAFVFAMLFLVFAAMAMQGHEHADEAEHAHE